MKKPKPHPGGRPKKYTEPTTSLVLRLPESAKARLVEIGSGSATAAILHLIGYQGFTGKGK